MTERPQDAVSDWVSGIREEMEEEIRSAGPLLDDNATMKMEIELQMNHSVPGKESQDIIQHIQEYAGMDDTPLEETIADAVSCFSEKPQYVKNVTQSIAGMVQEAVDARKDRIEAAKQAPKADAKPAAAAPATKPVSKGPGSQR